MPKAATVDSRDFDNEGGVRALLSRVFGRSPRDTIAIVVLVAAAGAILANALYRQPGPHPAPIFSVKTRPVAVEKAEAPAPARAAKAVVVPKAEPVQKVEAKPETVAAVPVPAARPAAKPDLIGDLISGGAPAPAAQMSSAPPPARIAAVQRALSSIGYGPVKATGTLGADTSGAIKSFERDRKLPVTGQVSPKLLKELAAVTGKPVE